MEHKVKDITIKEYYLCPFMNKKFKHLNLVILWKSILPQIPSMADLIKNMLKEAPTFLEDLTELLKNQDYESVL